MPRSLKKGPFVDDHLFRKVAKANEASSKSVIKTWSRRSMIIPSFLDGWAQARRVCSHPHLPWTREGRQEGSSPLTRGRKGKEKWLNPSLA
jgi:hypothetical protein